MPKKPDGCLRKVCISETANRCKSCARRQWHRDNAELHRANMQRVAKRGHPRPHDMREVYTVGSDKLLARLREVHRERA